MNKIFRLFAIATLAVSAWACESFDDYLEKTPDDDMTKDEVFTNPEWARSWLWNWDRRPCLRMLRYWGLKISSCLTAFPQLPEITI